MNTKQSLQRFEETANKYLQELESLDMEQLTHKPDEDEWSLGQMYMHLINSALYMQLRNVEACTRQETDNVTEAAEKTPAGKAVFAQSSFPPIRIQVPPSKEYTPLQPENKEQISEGLKQVIHRMREIEPGLDEASPVHTVPHPRFGALNAKEWYSLVEMHYHHHLLQMARLKEFLQVI
ncbi:DinB family protein [Aneurinibacillus tyrosinisolvens]|uniref:DinB family protein n=1 Tax=Aneurinibacillus tyrosinisolvens TaxID=1443435 RepID=UPI00063F0415|nr:DinB family protein [Aneurinibacillus tyrosinisolvens]